MSKVGEHYREREEMEDPMGLMPDNPLLSNCCGENFTYPGWPDSDICSKCHEHADIGEDDD
jgi:hypothetical protein